MENLENKQNEGSLQFLYSIKSFRTASVLFVLLGLGGMKVSKVLADESGKQTIILKKPLDSKTLIPNTILSLQSAAGLRIDIPQEVLDRVDIAPIINGKSSPDGELKLNDALVYLKASSNTVDFALEPEPEYIDVKLYRGMDLGRINRGRENYNDVQNGKKGVWLRFGYDPNLPDSEEGEHSRVRGDKIYFRTVQEYNDFLTDLVEKYGFEQGIKTDVMNLLPSDLGLEFETATHTYGGFFNEMYPGDDPEPETIPDPQDMYLYKGMDLGRTFYDYSTSDIQDGRRGLKIYFGYNPSYPDSYEGADSNYRGEEIYLKTVGQYRQFFNDLVTYAGFNPSIVDRRMEKLPDDGNYEFQYYTHDYKGFANNFTPEKKEELADILKQSYLNSNSIELYDENGIKAVSNVSISGLDDGLEAPSISLSFEDGTNVVGSFQFPHEYLDLFGYLDAFNFNIDSDTKLFFQNLNDSGSFWYKFNSRFDANIIAEYSIQNCDYYNLDDLLALSGRNLSYCYDTNVQMGVIAPSIRFTDVHTHESFGFRFRYPSEYVKFLEDANSNYLGVYFDPSYIDKYRNIAGNWKLYTHRYGVAQSQVPDQNINYFEYFSKLAPDLYTGLADVVHTIFDQNPQLIYFYYNDAGEKVEKLEFDPGEESLTSWPNGGSYGSEVYAQNPYTILVDYQLNGEDNYPAKIWIEYWLGGASQALGGELKFTEEVIVYSYQEKEYTKKLLIDYVESNQNNQLSALPNGGSFSCESYNYNPYTVYVQYGDNPDENRYPASVRIEYWLKGVSESEGMDLKSTEKVSVQDKDEELIVIEQLKETIVSIQNSEKELIFVGSLGLGNDEDIIDELNNYDSDIIYMYKDRNGNLLAKTEFEEREETLCRSPNGGDYRTSEYLQHPYTIYVDYKLEGNVGNYPANIWIEFWLGGKLFYTKVIGVENFKAKEYLKISLQKSVETLQDNNQADKISYNGGEYQIYDFLDSEGHREIWAIYKLAEGQKTIQTDNWNDKNLLEQDIKAKIDTFNTIITEKVEGNQNPDYPLHDEYLAWQEGLIWKYSNIEFDIDIFNTIINQGNGGNCALVYQGSNSMDTVIWNDIESGDYELNQEYGISSCDLYIPVRKDYDNGMKGIGSYLAQFGAIVYQNVMDVVTAPTGEIYNYSEIALDVLHDELIQAPIEIGTQSYEYLLSKKDFANGFSIGSSTALDDTIALVSDPETYDALVKGMREGFWSTPDNYANSLLYLWYYSELELKNRLGIVDENLLAKFEYIEELAIEKQLYYEETTEEITYFVSYIWYMRDYYINNAIPKLAEQTGMSETYWHGYITGYASLLAAEGVGLIKAGKTGMEALRKVVRSGPFKKIFLEAMHGLTGKNSMRLMDNLKALQKRGLMSEKYLDEIVEDFVDVNLNDLDNVVDNGMNVQKTVMDQLEADGNPLTIFLEEDFMEYLTSLPKSQLDEIFSSQLLWGENDLTFALRKIKPLADQYGLDEFRFLHVLYGKIDVDAGKLGGLHSPHNVETLMKRGIIKLYADDQRVFPVTNLDDIIEADGSFEVFIDIVGDVLPSKPYRKTLNPKEITDEDMAIIGKKLIDERADAVVPNLTYPHQKIVVYEKYGKKYEFIGGKYSSAHSPSDPLNTRFFNGLQP